MNTNHAADTHAPAAQDAPESGASAAPSGGATAPPDPGTHPAARTPRPAPRWLAATVGVAALMTVGAVVATSWHTTVEVLADGELQEVRLRDGTVGEALREAGVDLTSQDVVTPEPEVALESEMRVVVTRAVTVEVIVDGAAPITVTAPVATVEGVVHLAGLEDLRESGAVATPDWQEPVVDGDVVTITQPVEVVLEFDGERREVVTLAAQVKDLLSLHEVEVGPDDLVAPEPSSVLKSAQTIVVQRVEFVEEVEEVVLEHGEVRRDTSALTRGRSRVVEEGRDGLRQDTFLVTLTDGVETERELASEEVVTEPVDRVVEVGTAAPLPRAPAGAPSADDPVWTRLAQCESGNNWQANTGNGYYGGLQFHPQTWRSVGGSGLPHQASRAEQIRRAQILQQRSGWGQWPACSRRIGVR